MLQITKFPNNNEKAETGRTEAEDSFNHFNFSMSSTAALTTMASIPRLLSLQRRLSRMLTCYFLIKTYVNLGM